MAKKWLLAAVLACFMLCIHLSVVFAEEQEDNPTTLPFILKNENFAFHERTDAVIIDAGKEVDGASLSLSDFEVHVLQTRIVEPDVVAYDGPRQAIGVYVSQVNDVGFPSDTGRYIVIDFPDVGWGDGGSTNDAGYTFDSRYTIVYNGAGIQYADGSSVVPDAFIQTGVVSPVLDQFQYANYDGLDYSTFINHSADKPLPLVVFFHGGGQGNDIYTPIRFSNGGTVWANPENQAKYPSHVLAPRNAATPEDMHKVKAVINQMIADGKVDPNRVYITGFSMGGASTWTFLRTFPDFPAAAAPLCPAGGPDNVDNALAVAHLPLWTFVDIDDFLYESVVNTYNEYSPYWQDAKLSILPENRLDNPPYNGHVFDGHAVWLPVYNEYVDPERGMLIDWLFAQSKIRGIQDVNVKTVPGTAPVLPETVTVNINDNAVGIVSEQRPVTWEAIAPGSYDEPGTFTVTGTVEGLDEKVIATVTVGAPSGSEDALPFILRNENFAFHERTAAVIIDAGKEVDGASLALSDFDVHVLQTRIVEPDFVAYDGPREVIDVYVSQVNDIDSPSDTGRYIVIDFPDVGWGDGGSTNDGGFTFHAQYTIAYNGNGIAFTDGTSIVPGEFIQTDVVSPVLDQFQYASHDGMDYSYFINEDADKPLPLVVFFHGGGQGNDIYTPIRFSNGGTVWANPENQAKYPSHVLAPRNATTPEAMHKVKAVIDQMIEDGKVDPNRVYITGFSMGGGSTWTFLRTFPDFPAAAAPLCPAGGPDNVDNALAVAYLPLWTFVDVDDFLYNLVVDTYNEYSPYWQDAKLSILPENRLDNPPYNGHVFDGHAVWLPVYNEYVDPERGMLIDWLFAQSKVRQIQEVSVRTVPGTAPKLPETVTVSINDNATGTASEQRTVTWDAIPSESYGKTGSFTVEGSVAGIADKAIATVTVARRSSGGGSPAGPAPSQPDEDTEDEESGELDEDVQQDGYHRAYMSGYGDGTFRPNQTITRAELAAILARNLDFTASGDVSSPYPDVLATHWAAAEIAHVKQSGLMVGDQAGNFRPNDPITRGEMAVIAVRYKKLATSATTTSSFADVEANFWGAAAIEAAKAAGILDGYADGTFKPHGHLTRAELSK